MIIIIIIINYICTIYIGTIIQRHYNSSLQNVSKIPLHKNIPNVIKAYYAVYSPIPTFTLPAINTAGNYNLSNNNNVVDHISSSSPHVMKRQRVDTDDNGHIPATSSRNINSISITDTASTNNNNVFIPSTISNTSSSTTNNQVLWTVHESSKYRGNFYIIEPGTQLTKWINKESITFSNNNNSTSATTAVTNSTTTLGSFINPITNTLTYINKIEYAKN